MNDNYVKNRKNIIVLGDILEDVKMVDNINYKNLLTIGFLNNPKNLDKEL